MILQIEDIQTAIDRGWERLAMLQLDIAKKSRVSGDVNLHNKQQLNSVKLYSNIQALSSVPFNHSVEQNKTVTLLYNNIKLMTKNLKRWD